jgi:hypothetical protein
LINADLIEYLDELYDWFEDNFTEEEQEELRGKFEDNPIKFYNYYIMEEKVC